MSRHIHVHVWRVSFEDEEFKTEENASATIEIIVLRAVVVRMMRFAGSYGGVREVLICGCLMCGIFLLM